MNAFLIDIETIKKIGFVNSNVENNIISTTLRRVQDTMLRPIVGSSLYTRLLAGVDADDLNANEQTLLNDYILPVLVAGVDLRIINHLTYEIRSKTVGTTRDDHMTPVTESENNRLSDDLRADFNTYRKTLVAYLCKNETLFPEYDDTSTTNENIQPDQGKTRTNIRFN